MKRLKLFATLIVAIALSFTQVCAQSVKYDNFRIVKKSLTVGKSTAKAADSTAWLDIGDDTGTVKAVILPKLKDTGVIPQSKRKPATIFYNIKDSALWFQSGKVLKKVTAT